MTAASCAISVPATALSARAPAAVLHRHAGLREPAGQQCSQPAPMRRFSLRAALQPPPWLQAGRAGSSACTSICFLIVIGSSMAGIRAEIHRSSAGLCPATRQRQPYPGRRCSCRAQVVVHTTTARPACVCILFFRANGFVMARFVEGRFSSRSGAPSFTPKSGVRRA